MNTWTIINGDTLCLNGLPFAKLSSPYPMRDNQHDQLTRDERRELLEALNREER